VVLENVVDAMWENFSFARMGLFSHYHSSMIYRMNIKK